MQLLSLALIDSPRVRFAVRALGAILILFVGADHYYEYSVDQYSVLPTIGTLFLLNCISAIVVGVVLLAPLNRLSDKREYVARSSEVGQAYRRVVGRHFPAMTLVQVAALVDDRAKVEIEATAVVPLRGS